MNKTLSSLIEFNLLSEIDANKASKDKKEAFVKELPSLRKRLDAANEAKDTKVSKVLTARISEAESFVPSSNKRYIAVDYDFSNLHVALYATREDGNADEATRKEAFLTLMQLAKRKLDIDIKLRLIAKDATLEHIAEFKEHVSTVSVNGSGERPKASTLPDAWNINIFTSGVDTMELFRSAFASLTSWKHVEKQRGTSAATLRAEAAEAKLSASQSAVLKMRQSMIDMYVASGTSQKEAEKAVDEEMQDLGVFA